MTERHPIDSLMGESIKRAATRPARGAREAFAPSRNTLQKNMRVDALGRVGVTPTVGVARPAAQVSTQPEIPTHTATAANNLTTVTAHAAVLRSLVADVAGLRATLNDTLTALQAAELMEKT